MFYSDTKRQVQKNYFTHSKKAQKVRKVIETPKCQSLKTNSYQSFFDALRNKISMNKHHMSAQSECE